MKLRIAFVLGQFHREEVTSMLEEAENTVEEFGMEVAARVWVPGAMEAPLAAKRLLSQTQVDGLVMLGIIERGETKHGIVMAQAVTSALIGLQLEFMKPIGMGILGPEIFPSQISVRLKPYARSATTAVHHMLAINLS